jgi:adenylate cyclase class 2
LRRGRIRQFPNERDGAVTMLEVEIKFRVTDLLKLQRDLATLGANKPELRFETDHYFNAPDRDFARTDEALRLRRVGAENYVTYKGPKRDQETKTRAEIEVALAQGDEAAAQFVRLIESLGYRLTAEVHKQRQVYHLRRESFNVEVCLDEVREVGTFVEVEVITPEDQEERARNAILRLASDLGLERSERRSYLELLLVARGSRA